MKSYIVTIKRYTYKYTVLNCRT